MNEQLSFKLANYTHKINNKPIKFFHHEGFVTLNKLEKMVHFELVIFLLSNSF